MYGNQITYPGRMFAERVWEPRDTLEVLHVVIKEGMPAWLWWTINRVADLVVWMTGGPKGS